MVGRHRKMQSNEVHWAIAVATLLSQLQKDAVGYSLGMFFWHEEFFCKDCKECHNSKYQPKEQKSGNVSVWPFDSTSHWSKFPHK